MVLEVRICVYLYVRLVEIVAFFLNLPAILNKIYLKRSNLAYCPSVPYTTIVYCIVLYIIFKKMYHNFSSIFCCWFGLG